MGFRRNGHSIKWSPRCYLARHSSFHSTEDSQSPCRGVFWAKLTTGAGRASAFDLSSLLTHTLGTRKWTRKAVVFLGTVEPSERACGAVGSALPWHGRGRGFESLQVHQFSKGFLPARRSRAVKSMAPFLSSTGPRSCKPVVQPSKDRSSYSSIQQAVQRPDNHLNKAGRGFVARVGRGHHV